jgi:hypothetical protein
MRLLQSSACHLCFSCDWCDCCCTAVCTCPQVLGHDWVTDCGKLQAVQHYRDSQAGAAEAADKQQAGSVLTALKKQVGMGTQQLSVERSAPAMTVLVHAVDV